ncbi:MAG TPA: tetratricopeptide repeat protein, partial [Candidatus Polarisedimenticolia bacterium]|nr:tetratricopeptide repeat protein [Candidatus Polarisedimenticolia bacterium]
ILFWMSPRAPGAGSPAASMPARPAVALLPFHNATGDPALDWISTGLPDLVSGSLAGAPAVRVLSGDRTTRVLADLRLATSGQYGEADLRRASSVLGASIMITGTVRRSGQRYLAEADITGMQGGTPSLMGRRRAEGEGAESLVQLAGDLAEGIGELLGADRSPEAAFPLPDIRMEARRLYAEGVDLGRAGKETEAAAKLRQAVALEPAFAQAHVRMAALLRRLGRMDEALAASREAVRHSASLPPREAGAARAAHAVLENKLDAAVEAYREVLKTFPQDSEARYELGIVLEQKGDLEAAAAELASCTGEDPDHAPARYALGRIRLKQGSSDEALALFSDLLARFTRAGDEQGKGDVLLALGKVHLYASHYEEALSYYRQSLDARKRTQDRRGMAEALGSIATVLRIRGHYEEAASTSRQALDLAREVGEPRAIALEWRNLGEIEESAGRIQEARRCYQESLAVARDLDDPALLARISSSLGYISSVMGDYSVASLFYQEALAKRREIGDKAELLRSLIDLGLIEQWYGRYGKALDYAAEAAALVRETGETAGGVVLAINVGSIHDEQGSYAQALAAMRQALQDAGAVGDKELTATAHLGLGRILLHLGDTAGAARELETAGALIAEMGNEALLPEWLTERGALLARQGDGPRAMETLAEALRRAEALGDQRQILAAQLALGRWSAAAGRVAEGRERLAGVAAEARARGLAPLRVKALAWAGTPHDNRPPDAAAVESARTALAEASALGVRESQILALWSLSRHALAGKDEPEAARLVARARTLAAEMAGGLDDISAASLLGRPDIARLEPATAQAKVTGTGAPP